MHSAIRSYLGGRSVIRNAGGGPNSGTGSEPSAGTVASPSISRTDQLYLVCGGSDSPQSPHFPEREKPGARRAKPPEFTIYPSTGPRSCDLSFSGRLALVCPLRRRRLWRIPRQPAPPHDNGQASHAGDHRDLLDLRVASDLPCVPQMYLRVASNRRPEGLAEYLAHTRGALPRDVSLAVSPLP